MAGFRSVLLASLMFLAPMPALADEDVNIIGPPERAVDESDTAATEATANASTVQAVTNTIIIVNRRGFNRWRNTERALFKTWPWYPDEYSGRRYPF